MSAQAATLCSLTQRQRTGGWRMISIAEEWQRLAACKGPFAELFFPPSLPERKEDKIAREASAKSICTDCSVRTECLDYALQIQEPHGIWGGLNEVERRARLQLRASEAIRHTA